MKMNLHFARPYFACSQATASVSSVAISTISAIRSHSPAMGAAPLESGAKIGAVAAAWCTTWMTAMPVRYRLCSTVAGIKGQKIETPADLAGHNCLHYCLREFGNEWRFQRGTEEAKVRVSSNVVVNNSEVVRDLLLADMGIGLVWNYAVDREIADGRLIPLLPDWTPVGPFGQTAYALWLPQSHLPPKIRVFVDFFAARLQDTPAGDMK